MIIYSRKVLKLFGAQVCPLFCKSGHLGYYVFDCLFIRCSAFGPNKYYVLKQHNVFGPKGRFSVLSINNKTLLPDLFCFHYMYCVCI